jgi:hypothetical protein
LPTGRSVLAQSGENAESDGWEWLKW